MQTWLQASLAVSLASVGTVVALHRRTRGRASNGGSLRSIVAEIAAAAVALWSLRRGKSPKDREHALRLIRELRRDVFSAEDQAARQRADGGRRRTPTAASSAEVRAVERPQGRRRQRAVEPQ